LTFGRRRLIDIDAIDATNRIVQRETRRTQQSSLVMFADRRWNQLGHRKGRLVILA